MAKRDRMLDKAREYTVGTYRNKFVGPDFQKMIRAEYGASDKPYFSAVVAPITIKAVPRRIGQVVCVTCGKVGPWSSGLGGMHTGHFLASRRNSILFDEDNVAPQCSSCNRYRGGMPLSFRFWMELMRGQKVIERLEKLKTEVVSFTLEELVDMRIGFRKRLKAAKDSMRG